MTTGNPQEENKINEEKFIHYKNRETAIHPSKLLSEYQWMNKENRQKTIVSYSFHPYVPKDRLYRHSVNNSPVFTLNEAQMKQAKYAMQSISDVANIDFYEAPRGVTANIPIVNHDLVNKYVGGYAYHPDPRELSPVIINTNRNEHPAPAVSNYGGFIFIHEILHTMGLKHTHAPLGLTRRESVMSYESEHASDADFGHYNASAPQLYDITAIQYRYGANMHTRTGDTTYGFNSNSEREHFTARNSSDKLICCVWDAAGRDTFDFSGFKQHQLINLNQGRFSDVGGLKGNVSIAWGVTIENAVGGRGNDILMGNKVSNKLSGGDGADILYGGEGADHLYGGEGADIFCYRNSADSYTISSDTIYDFKSGEDKLDFSGLISPTKAIEFVTHFDDSGRMQMRQNYSEVTNLTYLLVDLRGQGEDFNMRINFTGKQTFTANDFIFGTPLMA